MVAALQTLRPQGCVECFPGLAAWELRMFSLCRKLTKVLKNYVENAEKLSDQLLKAMKAMEYIFKFIVRSRVLFNQ